MSVIEELNKLKKEERQTCAVLLGAVSLVVATAAAFGFLFS